MARGRAGRRRGSSGSSRQLGGGNWRTADGVERPVVTRQQGPVRNVAKMTGPQASYLRALCTAAGEKFNPHWTKKQASMRIKQLKRRGYG